MIEYGWQLRKFKRVHQAPSDQSDLWQKADGSWGIAHGADEIKEMGFWSINLDSMLFSIGLGVFFLWIFRRAAKKASTDAPTGLQNFIEMMIEFIDDSVRGSFSGKNPLVAPLALTIFVWVFLMNLMDLIPVDHIPWLASLMGVPYLKIVPSTDPNVTFGMSLSVFALVLYYSVKMKGAGRFLRRTGLPSVPQIHDADQPRAGRRHTDCKTRFTCPAFVRQPVCG